MYLVQLKMIMLSYLKRVAQKDWLEKFFIGDSKSFTVFDGGKMFNFFDTLKVLDGSLSEIAKTVGLKKGKTPLVKHPKKRESDTIF